MNDEAWAWEKGELRSNFFLFFLLGSYTWAQSPKLNWHCPPGEKQGILWPVCAVCCQLAHWRIALTHNCW
jgi:hypothetical protein